MVDKEHSGLYAIGHADGWQAALPFIILAFGVGGLVALGVALLSWTLSFIVSVAVVGVAAWWLWSDS